MTNPESTITTKPNNTRPWIWLTGLLAICLAVATFFIGYLLAKTQTNNTPQPQATSQQPTANLEELRKTLNSAPNKPRHAGKTGGILFSKNGYGKPVDNTPTIGLYEEPLCPYCGQLNRTIAPTIRRLFESGQINIDLHLVNFLNQASTDNYSNRTANGIIYIAKHDDNPTHLLDFLSNIYSKDFQPEEGSNYKPVSNDQLKELAIKAGVSEDIAAKAFSGEMEYQEWLDAADAYTTNDPTVLQQGAFSTPTVTINGTYWKVDSMDNDAATKLLKAIGLTGNQVGADAKPSIGGKGKPIAKN